VGTSYVVEPLSKREQPTKVPYLGITRSGQAVTHASPECAKKIAKPKITIVPSAMPTSTYSTMKALESECLKARDDQS